MLGIFDDCRLIINKLEAIKRAYQNGGTVSGYIPSTIENQKLEANYISLGNNDFDKVYFNFYGEGYKKYTINPREFYYTSWNVTPYETDPDKDIIWKGVEYRDKEKQLSGFILKKTRQILIKNLNNSRAIY
jgi:hypothetical protein